VVKYLFMFELCKEIKQFLRNRGSGIVGHFENGEFVMSLAYLADIFIHLNDLNTSIQGTAMNRIRARKSISVFTIKLSICISCIGSGYYANFPQLDEVSKKRKISLPTVIEI